MVFDVVRHPLVQRIIAAYEERDRNERRSKRASNRPRREGP
jgi:phosphate starvation-inducible protein PhoH